MMETASKSPGVLGEYPDRCVRAQRRGPENRRVSGFPPALDARWGGLVPDTAGEAVFSPPILRRRARERAKGQISG